MFIPTLSEAISSSTKKEINNEVEEPEKKEIDPLEFAQQLIIFVKDVIKIIYCIKYAKYNQS